MPPAIEPVQEEAVAATITRSKSTAAENAPGSQQRKESVIDVFAPAEKYYGHSNLAHRQKRTYTFSAVS